MNAEPLARYLYNRSERFLEEEYRKAMEESRRISTIELKELGHLGGLLVRLAGISTIELKVISSTFALYFSQVSYLYNRIESILPKPFCCRGLSLVSLQ